MSGLQSNFLYRALQNLVNVCFVHPFISFLVFCHFCRQRYENTKLLPNPCLYFARQDGQDGKNRKEDHATKVTKIPKSQKTKIWDERNISL
jgi:hypothetical protein